MSHGRPPGFPEVWAAVHMQMAIDPRFIVGCPSGLGVLLVRIPLQRVFRRGAPATEAPELLSAIRRFFV